MRRVGLCRSDSSAQAHTDRRTDSGQHSDKPSPADSRGTLARSRRQSRGCTFQLGNVLASCWIRDNRSQERSRGTATRAGEMTEVRYTFRLDMGTGLPKSCR